MSNSQLTLLLAWIPIIVLEIGAPAPMVCRFCCIFRPFLLDQRREKMANLMIILLLKYRPNMVMIAIQLVFRNIPFVHRVEFGVVIVFSPRQNYAECCLYWDTLIPREVYPTVEPNTTGFRQTQAMHA
jgi:hypothetical protein